MWLPFLQSCRHYRLKNPFGRLRKSNWTENKPGYFNPSSVALSGKSLSLLNGLRRFNTLRKMSFYLIFYDRDAVLQICDGNTRNFLAEALHRSPETLEQAASEWEAFADELFRNKGRVIPDWPQYVEIQEGVGIYGSWRRLKRRALKWWNVLWDELCQSGRKGRKTGFGVT